jgi:two-component system, LytTR family, response regulator
MSEKELNSIQALLLDDEQEANDLLRSLIENGGFATVCATLTKPDELDAALKFHQPDILFLDIQMPGTTGIEVLQRIRNAGCTAHVVFVTAFQEYLLEALRLNAFDYLLKPVDRMELANMFKRIMPTLESKREREKLFYGKVKIPTNTGIELLDVNEIVYLQAEGAYTHLKLANGKVIFSSFNLGRIRKDHLPLTGFLQISRSYIVNVNYLKRVDRHKLEVLISINSKDESLRYSRNYLQNLL